MFIVFIVDFEPVNAGWKSDLYFLCLKSFEKSIHRLFQFFVMIWNRFLPNESIHISFVRRQSVREEEQKKEEERKRYEETLKEARKDDDEFRKRADSDRRKRMQVTSISLFLLA